MDKEEIRKKQNANLRPFNTLSESEQREIRSKGGKKAVQLKQERKAMKEHLLMLLSEGNIQENILLSMIKEAEEKGNVKAAEFIRDTIGEKPTDKQQILSSNLQININRQAVNEQKDI